MKKSIIKLPEINKTVCLQINDDGTFDLETKEALTKAKKKDLVLFIQELIKILDK